MKMRSWNDRDHGRYTDALARLVAVVEETLPSATLGSSGAGELTIKYDPVAEYQGIRFSSFYVRPMLKLEGDFWLVKRKLNGEESSWEASNVENVVDFIASFIASERANNGHADIKQVEHQQHTRSERIRLTTSAMTSQLLEHLSTFSQTIEGKRIFKELLSTMLWKFSEADGAKQGNKYWTRDALALFESDKFAKGLIHEHTIPRKVLTEALMSLEDSSKDSVHAFLSKYCFATVVTREEDELLKKAGFNSSMPDGWSFEGGDVMARYIQASLSPVISKL